MSQAFSCCHECLVLYDGVWARMYGIGFGLFRGEYLPDLPSLLYPIDMYVRFYHINEVEPPYINLTLISTCPLLVLLIEVELGYPTIHPSTER